MNKRLVHQVFEQKAEQQPSATAIEYKSERVSYAELASRSDLLCREIESILLMPGKIIATLIPSSPDLVSCLLAIFKSGNIYMPLDLGFSARKLEDIFTGIQPDLLIVSGEWELEAMRLVTRFCPTIKIFRVSNSVTQIHTQLPRLAIDVDPDAGNYIFFTSGTAGKPKPILGCHKALSHFIHWEIGEFKLSGDCRVSQLTQFTFDASLRDIFVPLCCGGTLVIPEQDMKSNIFRLLEWIDAASVTLIHCVPSLFRLISREVAATHTDREIMKSVRFILMAGEPLYAKDIREWRNRVGEHIELVNLYGPTETTMVKTFHRIKDVPSNDAQVLHVGVPISNTAVAIINDGLPCSEGEVGEIYIKTPFASKGYYGDMALTKRVFVQNPLVSDKVDVVYKTGDLGRFLSDRKIEVLGRLDEQVKVNGVRIELGEIRSLVLNVAGVEEVEIIPVRNAENDIELVCYFIGSQSTSDKLRSALEESLDRHAIPGYFVQMDAFPLSLNGKVDKRALPLPDSLVVDGNEFEPVKTDIEARLEKIWMNVLGKERIGRRAAFFKIGGTSLKAIQVLSRVYKEFEVSKIIIADLFRSQTIAEFANIVAKAQAEKYLTIRRIEECEKYALSHAQKRLWIIDQLEGGVGGVYNIFGSYIIEGAVDREALRESLELVVDRHESLRTIFVTEQGEPYQKICSRLEVGYGLEYVDLRGELGGEEKAKELIAAASGRGFDLSQGPLIRTCLVQLEEDRYLLLLTLHHIIADGWSLEILFRDVLSFYQRLTGGGGSALPELRIQYRDYAAWQNGLVGDKSMMSAHREYWTRQLSGELPVLNLPLDYPRPLRRKGNGAVCVLELPRSLQERISSKAQEFGMSVFMVLLSGVKALLYRYTGQDDIIVGTPMAGREHIDLEEQIGFYVNMLALRTRIGVEDSFEDVMRKVKEVTLGGYEHQSYPFDLLVEDLGLMRDMSRMPVFDVLVSLKEEVKEMGQFHEPAGISTDSYLFPGGLSKFDLIFNFQLMSSGISVALEYNTDLFSGGRMERMLVHYRSLLELLVEDSRQRVSRAKYMLPLEVERMLGKVLGEKGGAEREEMGCTVVELFKDIAAANADVIALLNEGESVSYRELDERSNQLAHYLRSRYLGEKKGGLIGIMSSRSVEMIICIMGVLKAGAGYVPLDGEYPLERISHMVKDAGVSCVITDGVFSTDGACDCAVVDMQSIGGELVLEDKGDVEALLSGPDSVAYVMYTSGSAGRPKGVAVTHENIVNLVRDTNYVSIGRGDRILQLSNFVFDGSVFDIFVSLLNGGTLVIINKERLMSNERFDEYIRKTGVNIMFITTALFNNVVELNPGIISQFEKIYFGGERVSVSHVRKGCAYRKTKESLVHVYGPTEATTFTSFYIVGEVGEAETTIPIGYAVSGAAMYILNDQLELCPEGVEGEICIGGKGLSLGYVGDEELTMQKFVSNPYAKGERLYRSGDIGRYRWDGSVEFVGRRDSQVKLRGHRIELGEIEVIAGGYVGLSQPLAMIGGEGSDRYIVLYYRSEESLEEGKLRKYLKERLPGYMQPAYIVWMKEYPLTINGKVDYRSLPDAVNLGRGERAEKEEKLSEVEAMVLGVWERVLGRSGIGVQDSFFELGGDSIKAIKVASGIFKEWNKRISLADIFMNPTVSGLSALLAVDKSVLYAEIPKAPSQTLYPLSHAQSRLWIADQTDPAVKSVFNISGAYSIRGEIDKSALKQAFITVINRHESLRTIFVTEKGIPYQKIITTEESGYDFSFVDLSNAPDPQNEARNLCEAASRHCFDLSRGPLIITRLYQVASDEALLFMVLHHIICDGWSIDNMTREILSYYEAYHSGQEINSNPLAIQYKDFAAWQNQLINENLLDEHRAFWEKQLVEPAQYVQLPVDYKRTATRAYKGGIIRADISAEVALRVHSVSIKHDTTIFTTLFSLVNILLFRYCGQEDMAIGVPTTGRFRKELEDQIGFYVNTLPVRMHVDPRLTYEQFLDGTKGCLLEVFRHEAYPYILIKDKMHTGSHAGKDIFNVMVQLDRSPQFTQASNSALRNVQIEPYTFERISSKYDLTFFFQSGNDPDQLSMAIEYDSLLFKEESIEKMKRDLLCIIDCLMQNEKLLITDRRLVDSSAEEMEYSNFIKPM